jgi:hypothetical protein
VTPLISNFKEFLGNSAATRGCGDDHRALSHDFLYFECAFRTWKKSCRGRQPFASFQAVIALVPLCCPGSQQAHTNRGLPLSLGVAFAYAGELWMEQLWWALRKQAATQGYLVSVKPSSAKKKSSGQISKAAQQKHFLTELLKVSF